MKSLLKSLFLLLTLPLLLACHDDNLADTLKRYPSLAEEQKQQVIFLENMRNYEPISCLQPKDNHYLVTFQNKTQVTLNANLTPLLTLDENGHWLLNGEDTGLAPNPDSASTVLPYLTVDDTNHWQLNGQDTHLVNPEADTLRLLYKYPNIFVLALAKHHYSYTAILSDYSLLPTMQSAALDTITLRHILPATPLQYEGRGANFVGSSSMAGFVRIDNITPQTLPQLLCDQIGMWHHNFAIGGSTIAPVPGKVQFISQLNKIGTPLNLLFVGSIGGNDFANHINEFAFRSAMQEMCDYIQHKFDVPVFFLTYHNTPAAHQPHPLVIKLYRAIAQEYAERYGFYLVDGEQIPLPDTETEGPQNPWFGDDMHPSERGYKLWADWLAKLLTQKE